MSSNYTALVDLGDVAVSHREKLEEVKRVLGIHHGYFDAWMYGFLENKKFNVEETVAKLHRRFAMEVSELATYEFTDYMRESLRKGIIQEIGNDKAGRVAFYIYTKRDVPQSKYRDQQRKTFDMFVSYGTRLRKENKRCQIVMLINQEGSSMFRNVDMTFQADVALRISKFYPGGVDKMYICNMGRTLAAMAKPIFKGLPSIVSDRIQIIDSHDIKTGVLLDLFDENVLPVALGGKNDCDDQPHYDAYADKVENYYSNLKRAVNERGLTVKEAELQDLGIDPENANNTSTDNATPKPDAASLLKREPSIASAVQEVRSRRTARDEVSTVVSALEEMQPLMTCISTDNGLGNEAHSPYEPGMSWREVMSAFPTSTALFFLDELLRWRTDTEEQEMADRYKLMDAVAAQRRRSRELRGLDVDDHKWYTWIPNPLRSLFRLLLSGVTLINLVYLVFALVFYSVFVADLIVTTFFGFYVRPSFFFPLSCVLVMLMVQGASLCTRANDIIYALYQGRVIPLFERLGSHWGTVAEVILFFVLALVQLIIFIIYARRDSPLRGLQVSFATGWMSAMFLIAFYHSFYFTGLFSARDESSPKSGSLSSLPFFLTLGFGSTEQPEQETKVLIRTSSVFICAIPLVVSMLFGISFLISRIVSLYVCTLVAAMTAAFITNYCSEALSNSLAGSFLRLTVLLMTVAWLYVSFIFGFHNYDKTWASSVIVASILFGIFIIVALVTIKQQRNNWLLRIGFLMVLLYLLSTWIASIPLVGYKIGMFCLTMMVHNILNIVFSRRELTSIHSVAFLCAAVLLLSMSCVLLGWYGTTLQYDSPRSLPSTGTQPSLTDLELYHRYPVCTLKLGSTADVFTVTDVALLTEAVMAKSTAVTEHDLSVWFAGRGLVYDGVDRSFTADGISWQMHQLTAATGNLTFLVLSNKYAMSSIVAMVAWVDSIALSPLHIFLPWDWTRTIVYVISFVTRMISFEWRRIPPTVRDYLLEKRSELTTEIIVSGWGVAGGFAAMSSLQAELQSIVFASPGLLHELRKLHVTEERYHDFVLAVGAYYGVLDNVGGQDVTVKQKMQCRGSAMYCISPQYISTELLESCADTYHRRHVESK